MKSAGVIIVGAGLMGRWHARAARRAGARVLAIVDSDPARAGALAASCAGAETFGSLTVALEACDALTCHICTPLPTHARLATEALTAGFHVLVEKPFTDSLQSTRTVLELAESAGLLAMPVHQFVYQRGVRSATALLPEIGPLRQISFTACSAGATGGAPAEADRVAAEILPHPLSLLAHLMPGSLDLAAWQVNRPAAGEWLVQAESHGVGIQLLVSMGGRPPRNELALIGEHGSVSCDLFHGYASRESGVASRFQKVLRPFARALDHGTRAGVNLARRVVTGEPAYPGLHRLVERFYLAVAGAAPPPTSPQDILAIAAAHQQIRSAAKTTE